MPLLAKKIIIRKTFIQNQLKIQVTSLQFDHVFKLFFIRALVFQEMA